jgi:hypothetical protein
VTIPLMRKYILLWFFSAVGISCATKPVDFNSEKREGQWEAKAQIKNLENGKTNTVSLDVVSQKDEALRMEVTGTMGVSVASFLLKGSDVAYEIHAQKRHISGPASEKALQPLLNISVDPRWLYSVFFDEPVTAKDWTCEMGPDQLVGSCERSVEPVKIQWLDRQGERKRVIISNAKFELQVLVKNFETKVQSPERAFRLESNRNYKRYKLQ